MEQVINLSETTTPESNKGQQKSSFLLLAVWLV